MIILAVVLAAIAVVTAIGLVSSEGVRFDGLAQMSPWQPVHLKQRDGGELVIALGDLSPVAIDGAVEAKVMDDEGYGIRTLDHLRLDRRWAPTFKLDGGSMTFARGSGDVHSGFIANMQFGVFVRPWLGLLLTAGVGGAGDEYGATLTRHNFGFEMQSLPLALGPLQLGGYVNVGAAAIASTATGSGAVEWGKARSAAASWASCRSPARMALTLRAGANEAFFANSGTTSPAATVTAGIALYQCKATREGPVSSATRPSASEAALRATRDSATGRARQAQSWRRMASASRPSPISTSSVPRRLVAPRLAEREAGARARALEEAAPGVAREVDEALGAHQRRAQALDHREQRLGQQRLRIGERRRRRAGRARARGGRRATRRGAPAHVEQPGDQRRRVALVAAGKLARSAAGLRRASSRCSATTASPAREIQLGQQDPVGRLDLRARLLVARELRRRPPRRRRRRRRPAATAGAAAPSSSSPDRIDHGSAMPVVSSTTTSGRERRLTSSIAAHSSDCTRTSWQTQPPASSITSPARLLMRRVSMSMRPSSLMITPDAQAQLAPEHAVQRRGLARAEEPGQQHQRRLRWFRVVSLHRCRRRVERRFVRHRRRLARHLTGTAGNASGTQARTAATISGVGRSRSTGARPRRQRVDRAPRVVAHERERVRELARDRRAAPPSGAPRPAPPPRPPARAPCRASASPAAAAPRGCRRGSPARRDRTCAPTRSPSCRPAPRRSCRRGRARTRSADRVRRAPDRRAARCGGSG